MRVQTLLDMFGHSDPFVLHTGGNHSKSYDTTKAAQEIII